MTKIRTILKSSKKADGRQEVLLLVSDRGVREYISTGFTATPKEFDASKDVGRYFQGRGIPTFRIDRREANGTIKSYTNKEANDELTKLESHAQEIIKRYNENHLSWGFEQFRNDFTNAPKRNLFYSFSQSVIEKEYRQQDRFKRAEIANAALESLERYDKDLQKKIFQDITPAYIQGYIKFCRKRGNSNNTIGMRLREIRCFYNMAIRDKVVSPDLYPFSSGREDGKARIPKVEQNKTDQYLPIDSMKILAQAKIDNPILDRTRHLFLFSYYCRGMNWKDMALLTKDCFYKATVTDVSKKTSSQVTIMQYKRSKTKGEFDIQVTPRIQQELDWFKDNTVLFEDYVIPIIKVHETPERMDGYLEQIRKRANRSLKQLAKDLGLPESQQKISFYSARHSFAMTMQDKGKPVEIISQALGHQSVETTKHYLAKFSTTIMAEQTDIDLFLEGKQPKKHKATKAKTKKPKA